ncbi:MAG: hypothetical protein R2712_28085 [Vicinamibacterales bacterium]
MFDARKFEGEVITKQVNIKADFQSATGESSERDLVVTLTKFQGSQGAEPREGRWIITSIDGLP